MRVPGGVPDELIRIGFALLPVFKRGGGWEEVEIWAWGFGLKAVCRSGSAMGLDRGNRWYFSWLASGAASPHGRVLCDRLPCK